MPSYSIQGIETISPLRLTALFLFLLILGLYIRRRRIHLLRNPRNLPYPPGPKPLPIIGNFFEFTLDNQPASCQRLANEYGDLVFLSAMGKNLLFVNSLQSVHELFEKRSTNYSDRNVTPMAHDLLGWDFSFGHMRYGPRWKKHRRTFHSQFQHAVAPIYWPVLTKEAHSLLRRLNQSHGSLFNCLRHNAAAVIMSVTYGISIDSAEDCYVTIAEKALEGMAHSASPGAFFVDWFPMLKHVPEWFPGASFKRKAREWRAAVMEMKDIPFASVVDLMRTGQATPSFVSNLLNGLESQNIEEEIETIKNCAGMAYAAGAEGTVSTLSTFVLAMVLHQDVQGKAQEEIDSMVGQGRLPGFSDRASLPYTTAILKEVLRWNPIAPLGLPHMVTRDDEYNGYFIPAGTTVIGNSWGILHDPKLFPHPHLFDPERFMGKDDGLEHLSPLDPLSVAFGYGRRICPGRHMAEAHVWITMVCLLSAFKISPLSEEKGSLDKRAPGFSGMISRPSPFEVLMKPRSEATKLLIEQIMNYD